jgi:K+-sensing histidine kinase KdpD
VRHPGADLQRIFQRFARAEPHREKAERSGLGLGLAIVQAIAEAHGGSVRVQSTFGHGSKFRCCCRWPRRGRAPDQSARRGNGQTGDPMSDR